MRDTVDWYLELIDDGIIDGGAPSPLSLGAAGLRWADRVGALAVADAAAGRLGLDLVRR